MKLNKLKLHNFRSFELLELDLGDRLTLLIGDNGSGKTSILDSIAVGFGAMSTLLPKVKGISFKKTDIRQIGDKKAPYVQVTLNSNNGITWSRTERSRRELREPLAPKEPGISDLKNYVLNIVNQIDYQDTAINIDLPVYAYYGVSRALLDVPLSRKGFSKSYNRFEAYQGALDASSNFRSAFKWFYYREQDELRWQREQNSFDVKFHDLLAVRTAIEKIFKGVSNPRILTNPLRFVVDVNGESLDINQLSDGYKTMLGLVMDLAYRMSVANPHLSNPLSTEAFVMIDEIDLHLHPEWQRRVISDLMDVFKNTQFIVTTHSPFIVESINYHLLAYKYLSNRVNDRDWHDFMSINPQDIAAYHVGQGVAKSIFDKEHKLIDNSLIDTFNKITMQYSQYFDLPNESDN